MQNFLSGEDSPYLQQHKHNPVHWYPWCDEAFKKAKSENRALFISIGYSSCHWCHVMENEVFEDEKIASYLNEHFICIKVDREERPDIDKYYQDVHMILNQRPSGWPTSIFSTPDNKPFFAGTYIPPKAKYNMMGFMQLLKTIAPAIAKKDNKLFGSAKEIDEYLHRGMTTKEPFILSRDVSIQFLKQVQSNFEPTYGGFGSTPKFPQASTLMTLMNLYQLDKNDEIASMVQHTLDNMSAGGMYDVIDGGFCRYSVDSEWLVPHFEKMTYDNALLCEVYLHAYMIFNDDYYLEIAQEIAKFMQKFMMKDDLFYSASDADTQGVEGKYFFYTHEEVIKACMNAGFDALASKKMTMRMGCSKEGNFEGHNIIRFVTVRRPEWFNAIKVELQHLRHARVYPFIDTKIQTSWNAMMVKALFELSIYNPVWLDQAVKSMDALLLKMNIESLMHSSLLYKAPKIGAFLEDYAYLGMALISAYEVTADVHYLKIASSLAQTALDLYFENGNWYFSRGEFETFADVKDESYPGSVGVMVDLLLSLGSLVDADYKEAALLTLEYYAFEVRDEAIFHPNMVNQTMRYIEEDTIVKVPQDTSLKMIRFESTSPYTKVFYHDRSDFLLCNTHSCYAHAQSIEVLFNDV